MATEPNKQSSTVILARVSSKAQEDEGYSLDSQLKLLQGYCQSKGLDVVKVFKIAETASKEQSRKIFHELLVFMNKEKIYHLAVEKTDRLTRNFRDAVAIDEWLDKDSNRRLHAVKENLLLHKEAKSDVKFMWNIHISVAKKYTDNLREESMKGWTEKLAQGWMPAPPPPGYKSVIINGKRVHAPDESTKHLIRRIFKLYLEPHHSIASITYEMKMMGIRTKKGHEYHKSRVQHILSNPYYIGINRFDGKDYPGAQEPIISRELFDKVQNKLHRGRPPILKKHNPVFKNLIHCKDCGGIVTWQLQKGHYYGSCQRRSKKCLGRKLLREDLLEARITTMLNKLVCPSPNIISWVAYEMRKQHAHDVDGRERLADSMKAQIERISRMDETLYDDKLSGEITPEKYVQKHQQLRAQKAEIEEKLAKIDVTAGQKLDQKLVILELSQKAAELYPKKSPDQKRIIITALFNHLTYIDDAVSVTYSNFSRAIAQRVILTRKLIGGTK
jgi:site-specific DNA recombinase